ncbi:MAG: zf-TFIIB domain-containing protein [Burkholderiales bacterium]|nr:zf-TFIIB domain-containing protein [Burkholderiales bacterium]
MSASQFPPLTSRQSNKRCTNCSTLMSLYELPGHYGQSVELDVCHDCNAIWFDQWESSQLSPDGTVALFQLINERGGASSTATSKFGEGLRCVTCGSGMRLTNDRVKNTRFTYQSCPKGHGRLTTFYNFLAEKQFVRELTQQERARLAASVQQIKCSSCAAPVNIGKTDACEYCRAPVSVFDRDAAKKAIDHYLQERHKQVPAQYPAQSPGYGYSSTSPVGWGNWDTAGLAADILFALGRAAARGVGHAGARVAPAAVGAGAGSVLADTGSAATGGLLDSIGSNAGGGALPTATDALFGNVMSSAGNAFPGASGDIGGGLISQLGSNVFTDGTSTSVASAAADALPSATDVLFGASGNGASGGGGLLSDIGSVFSDAGSGAASSVADGIGSAASEIGGSAVDVVSDVASSAGDGIVDLVADGIGSLLGSLFD